MTSQIQLDHSYHVTLTHKYQIGDLHSLSSPKSDANGYFVFHFVVMEIDQILRYYFTSKQIPIAEFEERYIGLELIDKVWIKEKIEGNRHQYSVKQAIEDEQYICWRESKNEVEIDKLVHVSLGKSLEELNKESYARFYVKRCEIKIDNTSIHIECSQTEEDAKEEINDFYLVCECQAKNWIEIGNVLKKCGLYGDTILYPVPSKVVEYLWINDQEKLDDISSLDVSHFDDQRILFHRKTNPFDASNLNLNATKQDVQTWCQNLYTNEDFTKHLCQIASDFDGEHLYNATIVELLSKCEENNIDIICGAVLFFRLHMWESPITCFSKESRLNASKTQCGIDSMTKADLEFLITDQGANIENEVKDRIYEQMELWSAMENAFNTWQVKNKVKPLFIL